MSTYFGLFQLGPLVTLTTLTVRILVGIVVAMAVYRNASDRPAREFGIPSIVWAGLALAEPALGLFVYWFLHRDAARRTV